MSTPGELDLELQRRLQRYGATVDRAAADAQLARAAGEPATGPAGAAGMATVSHGVWRRRRVGWRVLVTAAASVIVMAGAIGILLARGDGEPADRGMAASTGSGPTTVVEVAPDRLSTTDSTATTSTTAASTTTVVTTTVATTQPAVPVGPPPLAVASTTTAPAGSDEARRPVCPSYTFRVEYSLRLCDKGPAVHIIQQRLVASGETIGVDGYFGPGTEQAVRRFQDANGLDVDGWVGPDTWRVLVPDAPGVDVDGNGIVDPPELAPS